MEATFDIKGDGEYDDGDEVVFCEVDGNDEEEECVERDSFERGEIWHGGEVLARVDAMGNSDSKTRAFKTRNNF